jgi:8-oxo-dGTP diphosphatase
LDKPSDDVKAIEEKLAGLVSKVDVTDETLERGRQIEAAADGDGFYPVHRAADEPHDDPERIQRYGVATEEGMIFVRTSWAKIGDESRVVAYDVEPRDDDKIPSKFFRERLVEAVQNHIKCAHLKALGFPKLKEPQFNEKQRCPHDGGACHHDCEPGECYREAGGMSLSSPHEGYPLPPPGWVAFDLGGANVGVPDDHNVYLDTYRLTPGRKMDYIFHLHAGEKRWKLLVDPTVVQEHVDRGQGEALLRICHMTTQREIPCKDVHELDAASIIHPPRGREVEVWRFKWQFHGTDAGDTVKHTDHCYKRMIHGDGECECGGRVGIKPAKLDVAYDRLGPHVDLGAVGATMCTTHVFETSPEATKPTLEGLEERLNLLEAAINELMDRELAQIRKAIAQHDSKAFNSLQGVAQMDGRVQQALKGVSAHEEWLQGLERRFAEAAVSGGDKASRALLKTVLRKSDDLESRTAAQKDLGSALSKKVGEVAHHMDEVRSVSLRLDRMIADIHFSVAKLIEITVGNAQLAELAEDDDNCNLLGQFKGIQEIVEGWEEAEEDESDPCEECEHEECEHCDGCGCVSCECECDDPEDDEVPFDEAAKQIREQIFPVGTRVGFCGNSTMKGVVKGKRKGPKGPERMVSWKDEKETTGGGWYGVDDLYELDEPTRAAKVTSNGPELMGMSPVVIPVSGLYMSSTTRGPIQLTKGTYSLITGAGEPAASLHWDENRKVIVPTGVAVLVIKDSLRGGQWVLLGKRKGAHGEGQWALPGGRIEPHERPVDCAVRELEEETGIALHPDRLQVWQFCPFNNTITGGQPWVTLFYWVQVSEEEGKHKLMEPDKCESWDYFLTKNMPEPLFEASAECARQSGWTIRSEVDHCSDD